MFALALIVGVMCWRSEVFRKPENFLNILNANAFMGIAAVGMTGVMILGGIDLSVGSMVGLLAGTGLMTMNWAKGNQWSDGGAMMLGGGLMLAGGPLLGLLNGGVIVLGRVAPFIATLGMFAIYRSIVLASADGGEIRSSVPAFNTLGTGGFGLLGFTGARGQLLKITHPTLIFLGVGIIGELLLRFTTSGRRIFAVGDNSIAAHYAGVKLGRTTLLAYAALGACCGLAALLSASRMNSVSSAQTGINFELDAIAAVVIGGTSMRGGRGTVLGTIVGVLILGVINNALNLEGVSPHLQGAAKGCIIIAAVLIQRSGSSRP